MYNKTIPGVVVHRMVGKAYPYLCALAAAALVNPYAGTTPPLNVIPFLPAGTIVLINGQVYKTRSAIQSGQLGEMDPINEHPSVIGPKKVGDTFVDRAAVYWDIALNVFTSTSGGGNVFYGYAVANPDLGTATQTATSTLVGDGTAGTTVTGGTSYDNLPGTYAAADTLIEVECVKVGAITITQSSSLSNAIADPGTGVAIPVTATGSCQLVLAGIGETNTLAAPTFEGQQLLINAKTVAASATRIVTVAANIDGTNNTITFSAAAQFVKLVAVSSGSAFVWQLEAYRGAALSHV